MEKYDIIFNSNGIFIQKYEAIEKIYLEKFEYFMMLIRHSTTKSLIVEWDKINVMKDILDTLKRTHTGSSKKSDITFDEYSDALNYLGCNISVFNYYIPSYEEYDVFKKCKSDAELNYFIQMSYKYITYENIKSYFSNRNIDMAKAIDDFYQEMVSKKNYNEIEYLLTNISLPEICFDDEIPDISFLKDCDESFANKYPAIWWIHLLITNNLEGQEKYMDTIMRYCKRFVEHTFFMVPEETADKFMLKYNISDELILPKISAKLLEKIYETREVYFEYLDLPQLVELFIRANNIKLIRQAAISLNNYHDKYLDCTGIIKEYSETEIENRFDFLLDKLKDLNCTWSFVCKLKDDSVPGSYSFWVNNRMYSNRKLELPKNRPKFKFSEDFFMLFPKMEELDKIEYTPKNNYPKVFLKTDCPFLPSYDNFVIKVGQPPIIPGPEISTDYINLFDRQIEQMFVSKNMIILEPYGHIKIQKNSSISFYSKLENFNLFYFANNANREKIVIVYNNKIKIYKSLNMFYYALYAKKAFFNFICEHGSFEL